jgi:hypothetical protein
MKAYKVELLIIDLDQIGPDSIEGVIENTKYPNWCIHPHVMKMTEKDIGEWHEDHPLNKLEKWREEYNRLFEKKEKE